jgi:hypothetical protein
LKLLDHRFHPAFITIGAGALHQTSRELTTSAGSKALTQLTDAYLEETGVNGYDNDGGLGQLEIDVAGGEVTLTIDCRYTHSNTAFVSQKEIETGEEL